MPINKLPFELTVAVLLDSMTPDDNRSLGRLQNLAQVQTAWWHVIKSHPQFWNTIHVDRLHTTTLRLHKSGGLPLNIVCHWNYDKGHDVEPHKGRVISVDYHRRTSRPLQNFLNVDMPRLETLVVVIPSEEEIAENIQLSRFSRLRYLHLENLSLRWRDVEFRHLETLILSGYEIFRLSLPEFVGALRCCLQLQKMRLEYIAADERPLPPTDPILLPRLRSLSINGVGYSFIFPLISILQPDGLTQFNAAYKPEDPNGGLVARALLDTPSPSFLKALINNPTLHLQRLDLRIGSDIFDLKGMFMEREAKFKLNLIGVTMDWILELGPDSLLNRGVPLHVTVDDDVGDDFVDMSMVNVVPFTGLIKLELSCGPRWAAAIARTLFGDPNRWPCSKLEEIHADLDQPSSWKCERWEWDETASALTELLERRNNEAAHAAGVAKLTLYVDDRPVTNAEDVQDVINAFIYEKCVGDTDPDDE